MRRVTASLLVALGLFSASLAWWSFAARFTVLDPGRSPRIADVLVDQPVIRDAVADGLAAGLRQALPADSPVSAAELGAVAHRALDDPRAVQALRTAIIDSHQRLVGNYDGPVHVDVSPIAAAGRDALLAARPDLAASLPQAPPLSIDLPTQHLPNFGLLSERTRELTGLAGLVAATLLGLGVLVASDRPGLLRRSGRWAVRAGVGWALFGWALPYGLAKLHDPRLAALGAIGVAAAGPMVGPAVTLVCAGVAALLGARAWRLAMAALPDEPPSGGPGSPFPGPPAPPPGARRSTRPRDGERVPVPAAARPANPLQRPRRPAEGATRTWWA